MRSRADCLRLAPDLSGAVKRQFALAPAPAATLAALGGTSARGCFCPATVSAGGAFFLIFLAGALLRRAVPHSNERTSLRTLMTAFASLAIGIASMLRAWLKSCFQG